METPPHQQILKTLFIDRPTNKWQLKKFCKIGSGWPVRVTFQLQISRFSFFFLSFSLSIYLYLYLWLLLWLNSSLKFKRFGWIMNTVLFFSFSGSCQLWIFSICLSNFPSLTYFTDFLVRILCEPMSLGPIKQNELVKDIKKSKFEARNETKNEMWFLHFYSSWKWTENCLTIDKRAFFKNCHW